MVIAIRDKAKIRKCASIMAALFIGFATIGFSLVPEIFDNDIKNKN
jgi:hypothetical protein